MQSDILKSYIYALAPQAIIVSLIVVFKALSYAEVLPPPEELALLAIDLLANQGILFVMLASFIENFAGFGTYFPFSVAILAAMAGTGGDPERAILVFLAIVIPAIFANIASYFVGYLSRGRDSRIYPVRTTRGLFAWYGATYWHPQFAAISAVASGGEGIPFKRYFSHFLPVSLLWSAFWAILMYNVGHLTLSAGFFAPIFYVYLALWIVWGIRKHKKIISQS